MTFIRSDIPARRRMDLESSQIEGITYEVNIDKCKWCIVCMYRPPSQNDNCFSSECVKLLDKCSAVTDKIIVMGDLNYDMLDSNKSKSLSEISDLFDLHCVVKSPTCHVVNTKPSLVDSAKVTILSSKLSNWDSFVHDLGEIQPPDPCADVNKAYSEFVGELNQVIDKHAPVKQRYQRKKLPCMNRELRKAIYVKHMLYSKYVKYRNSKTWEKYRQQRNLVEKIKRRSMSRYFIERCTGGHKSDKFWPTIMPFLSKKGNSNGTKIILEEEGQILSDNTGVCETFNSYYVNVAKDIGKDVIFDNLDKHPSIEKISESNTDNPTFTFNHVSNDNVNKSICGFNVKKATGVDSISVKILKEGKEALVNPITTLVNMSINTCIFPNDLKLAQVCPIFKKGDCMDKTNYRPVSVLPIMSKIFEKALSSQLSEFFEPIFNKFLCAFRKGYGCQTTLLRLIEDWKMALDQNMYVAAILMDLLKAFDCLPHNVLLRKLEAYGLSGDSLNLMHTDVSR
ncbi:hypothetical protein FSP39_025464 [Pinctada imbricata]|uniref:Reverse transcriptase domain-containing protein n=1 Tax=Pinctada imbricata TaxID=66713 RepID=A0AA88Y6S5_PINIB|nr:hypothetical protein FSP39_025464 [Pinctada imbricata]